MKYEEFEDIKNVVVGIYEIRNTITGKRYIGQSKNIYERWRRHVRGYGGCAYICNAIQHHGVSVFDFSIIEEAAPESLDALEIKHISLRDTVAPNGYNLTSGGRGARLSEHSELKQKHAERMSSATRLEKFSIAMKNRWADEEFKQRQLMKRQQVGYVMQQSANMVELWKNEEYRRKREDLLNSEEHKKKISEIQKASWQTEEHRENHAKAVTSEQYKHKMREALSAPEYIEHISKTRKLLWQDPLYIVKVGSVKVGKPENITPFNVVWSRIVDKHPEVAEYRDLGFEIYSAKVDKM